MDYILQPLKYLAYICKLLCQDYFLFTGVFIKESSFHIHHINIHLKINIWIWSLFLLTNYIFSHNLWKTSCVYFTLIQVEYPLYKMLRTRSVSAFGIFQIWRYLYEIYTLNVPNLKIENALEPETLKNWNEETEPEI